MAQNFLACDRDQPLLLPPDLRDWLPADHLAWFVIEAVHELDLEPFYAAYRADGHAAAHDPQMMVTLLVYAYAVGERSSRAIERRCREDVAFRVICANQGPDHATIGGDGGRDDRGLGDLPHLTPGETAAADQGRSARGSPGRDQEIRQGLWGETCGRLTSTTGSHAVSGGWFGIRIAAATAPARAIATATRTAVWKPSKKPFEAVSWRARARLGWPAALSWAAAPKAVPTERCALSAIEAGNRAGSDSARRLA
jgi:transposase